MVLDAFSIASCSMKSDTLFEVNVSGAKDSFEFYTFSYQLIDCCRLSTVE